MPRTTKTNDTTSTKKRSTKSVSKDKYVNECVNVLCGEKNNIEEKPTTEKKRRGRPRKVKAEEPVVEVTVQEEHEEGKPTTEKKRRGRSKKVKEEPVVEVSKEKESSEEEEVNSDLVDLLKECAEDEKEFVTTTITNRTMIRDKVGDEYLTDEDDINFNFDNEEYDVDFSGEDDVPPITPEELKMSNYCLFSGTIIPINKRDVRKAIKKNVLYIPKAGSTELKKLVDMYYRLQKFRIMCDSQVRSMIEIEPESDRKYLEDIAEFYRKQENHVKLFLDCITDEIPVCNTIKQVCGIGPVISAGLYAHFDIRRAKTAGAYWRYCGIDPTLPPMIKGEKLKYNKELKTLVVFKLGDSFIKVKNNKRDLYGHYYDEYKEYYESINEKGGYAERCSNILNEKKFKDNKTKQSYLEGKLPAGHIHSMSRRKPVTIFISHLFDLQYMLEHGEKSPRPYIIAHSDEHVHEIENPLVDIFEKLYGCHPTKYNR